MKFSDINRNTLNESRNDLDYRRKKTIAEIELKAKTLCRELDELKKRIQKEITGLETIPDKNLEKLLGFLDDESDSSYSDLLSAGDDLINKMRKIQLGR